MTIGHIEGLLLQQANVYIKSHGLGNEYIVLNQTNITFALTEKKIQTLCNVHYGLGADGILLKINVPEEYENEADFSLKIYNPDGTEAKRSGNGLRIFAKYLYDYRFTQFLHNPKKFKILTKSGVVSVDIIETTKKNRARQVIIDMGKASFTPKDIIAEEKIDHLKNNNNIINEIIDQKIAPINNQEIAISAVSIGNPHFVYIKEHQKTIPDLSILKNPKTIKEIKTLGKAITKKDAYNVNFQLVELIQTKDNQFIDYANVLIYERGVGFTLASGSSACAVAVILKKKKLIKNQITINMPGGELTIEISDDYAVKMKGEVREICLGLLSEDFFAS